MTDNKLLATQLQKLGLGEDEAIVYLKLLEGPSTHLRLSRDTGISRSKVYRTIEALEQRGVASHYADDTGRFIIATSPEDLEITIAAEEERIREKQDILATLSPLLLKLHQKQDKAFTIHTYENIDGFRQMLWHELKARDEVLVLGGATIEQLTPHPRWAERHRRATIQAGYRMRELGNQRRWTAPFTRHAEFSALYTQRYINKTLLPLEDQIAIYNSTVSIYHWQDDQKVGLEITGKTFSTMMRHVFESYWLVSQSVDAP